MNHTSSAAGSRRTEFGPALSGREGTYIPMSDRANELEQAASPQRQEEPIFALDIGTRSVIGVVGYPEGDTLRVVAVESQEHAKRAVVDGQIEDIEQTARVAQAVRERLEGRLGFSLKSVCVAAAGRVLKTCKTSYETGLDERELITRQQVAEMESHAIQQAYESLLAELDEGEKALSFYCVGHTVTRYFLDDYEISTLVDHRGRRVRLEVIATFLPTEVVESLYATMAKVGLTISSVTLEPIAAMNAVVPKELRLLNIALVDIGAGTSDIAISNNGSVVAYTMATVAGDEITEQIMREYLVDFETAERMKHQIGGNRQELEYTDILGFSYSVSPSQVLERVGGSIGELSQVIGSRILEANGGPPVAVFLVGGGSQTPELCRLVAQELNIDPKKVAVGGNNYMKRMVQSDRELSGPEYATPIGIALTALSMREHDSFTVTLNGQTVRMLKNSAMTTIEVLLMSGYQHSQIMGRSGRSVTFQLNGARKVVRGELPTVAVITVNGVTANITTPVHPGDALSFQPAVSGQDARPVISELVEGPFEQFRVSFGGRRLLVGHVATINGKPAGPDEPVHNLDRVRIHTVRTLEELCLEAGFDPAAYRLQVNGQPASPQYRLQPEDEIVYYPALPSPTPAADHPPTGEPAPPSSPAADHPPTGEPAPPSTPAADHPPASEPASSLGPAADHPPASEPASSLGPAADHPPASEPAPPASAGLIRITLNESPLTLPPKADGAPYQFFDLLNFVEIDPSKPQGNIVQRLNGQYASYLATLQDGDEVEIYWDRYQGGQP